MMKRTYLAALLVALGFLRPAEAQNTVELMSATLNASESGKVVIAATTSSTLTLLSLDLTFDPALCGQLETQAIVKAGRAVAEAQEGGVRCPDEGRVSIIFFDLAGEAVIPAGEGPIAEWQFTVRADATGGEFPLAVTVRQASNGPLMVPLATTDGVLTITGAGSTCLGDCDGSDTVAVNELVSGVRIALDTSPLSACPSFDGDHNERVEIPELIQGVNHALRGCASP